MINRGRSNQPDSNTHEVDLSAEEEQQPESRDLVTTGEKFNMMKVGYTVLTQWEKVLIGSLAVYALFNFSLSFIGGSLLYASFLSVLGHFFGFYQIHLLGSLAEKLRKFQEENEKFAKSNEQLSDSVRQFQEQNAKLKNVADSLREENARFKAELDKLSGTIRDLESVKDTIEAFAAQNKLDFRSIIDNLNETVSEQRKVVVEQGNILKQQKSQTKLQEKVLLMQLHSQCQFMDQQVGMSPQEFQLWLNIIPKKYLESDIGLQFDQIDSDRDGLIDTREFNSLLDKLINSVDM